MSRHGAPQVSFEAELSAGTLPYLRDHRVHGVVVLPTAAFLEMAVAAGVAALKAPHTVADLMVEEFLTLPEDAPRHLRLVLHLESDVGARLEIASVDGAAPRVHVRGRLEPPGEERPIRADLEEIRGRCRERLTAPEFYARCFELGLEHGPCFRGLTEVWCGSGEALGEVRLPSGLVREAAAYQVHPALLDACLQVVIAALPPARFDRTGEAALLAGRVARFRLHRRPPARLWAHAVLEAVPDAGSREVDAGVHLLDESGLEVARLERLGLRAPPPRIRRRGPAAVYLYEPRWRERPRQHGSAAPVPARDGGARHWVVFADRGGLGRAVAELLRARGRQVVTVVPGDRYERPAAGDRRLDPGRRDDYARLLAELDAEGASWAGLLHLWSLEAPPVDDLGLDALERARSLGCVSLLSLLQALAGGAVTPPPPVWAVTRGAQRVHPADRVEGLAQSPVWGLGRAVAANLPRLHGGLVDLDPRAPAGEAAMLLAELEDPDGETQLAFRDGRRLVPRLAATEDQPAGRQPRLRGDATYLVTGGLGRRGLRVSRWLVEGGARHLVLVDHGRPRRLAAVRALRDAGAEVELAVLDAADQGALTALVQRLDHPSRPPLRGVLHAVEVPDGGDLLDADRVRAAARPTATTAWLLHELLGARPLDFFVCFSSAAGLLGSPGSVGRATADAFLDALAQHRQATGRAGLSLDWWPWVTDRLGAPSGARPPVHAAPPIEPTAGLAALARALASGAPQGALLPIAPDRWPALAHRFGDLPLLEDLAGGETAAPLTRERLLQAVPGRRRRMLVGYLRDLVAEVTRVNPGELDPDQPLHQLGLDSLMAMEIRRRLAADLHLTVPAGRVLERPSIAALAGSLLHDLADAAGRPPEVPGAPDADDGEFPLSRGQQSMWFLYQLAPQESAYHLGDAVVVRGALDVDALRRAFEALTRRHPALRTTFGLRDGIPVQRVGRSAGPAFRYQDASGWGEERLRRQLAEDLEQPFDLEHGPVVRLHVYRRSADEHALALVLHHIVGELWALIILTRELSELYRAESSGPHANLPPLHHSYRDFVRWEAALLAGPEGERHASYWQEKLAGSPSPLAIPTDRPRPPVKTYRGALRAFVVDRRLTGALKELAASNQVTLYTVLLAALAGLLRRYSGQQDMVIGSPVSGRNRPEWEGVVGFFDNPVPLRVDLSGDPSFRRLLGQLRQTVLEALEHRDFPLPLIIERVQPPRDPSRSPLFDVMLVLRQSQVADLQRFTLFNFGASGVHLELGNGLEVASTGHHRRVAQLDLTLAFTEVDGELHGSWEYNTDLFEAATVDRMTGHLQTLLRAAVADPDRPVTALPLLTGAERRQLASWNATDTPFPRDALIQQGFQEQAARRPGAVAVVDTRRRITYRALEREARGLGRWLRQRGALPDTLVAVVMEKGWEQVVGVLGVEASGAAYLPLDPSWPRERLWHLMDRCDVRLAVTQPWVEHAMAWPPGVERFAVAEEALAELSDAPLTQVQAPDHLAYVIFTSGSTGLPKGVMIDHRGAVNTIADINRRFAVGPADRVLALSSLSFDLSVYDIFGLLAAGGTVVLPDAQAAHDPLHWLELLERESVTVWNSVPALAELLAECAADQGAPPSSLRLALLSGDWIPVGLPGQLRRLVPGMAVVGLGGATEASIWSILHPIGDLDPAARSVPYGRPMANQRFHVLDEALQPCPVGTAGQLFIGGVGLARGYWRDQERTGASFVAHPDSGERLYRTGDLGRWLPDGTIEFMGRMDNQVKLRGFRVELGEVEAALRRLPGVREAVVVLREDQPGQPRLVGYLLPAEGGGRDPLELRERLRASLPEYMVPGVLVALDSLPLSPNGKVDRRALPPPEQVTAAASRPWRPPRTAVERQLAEIWAAVLGVDRVGRDDNLFQLGGDSVHAIQISVRARRAGLAVTPTQLFEHQTVAALAEAVGPVSGPAADRPGTVPGPVPLSPAQRDLLRRAPARWTTELVLRLRRPLDPAVLEAALHRLADHHDALRLRFSRHGSGWRQSYGDAEAAAAVRRLPATGVAPPRREAMAALRDGVDLAGGPVLLAGLLGGGAAEPDRLLLVAHRLVVDPPSWPILLQDLVTAYLQLEHGEPVALPPRTAPFHRWARRLEELARAPELRAEAGHWLGLADLALSRPPGAVAPERGGPARVARRRLGRDETEVLLRRVPAVFGAQVPEVVLTAIAQAVQGQAGAQLLVEVDGDGRDARFDDLDLSRTVGCLTSSFPLALPLGPDRPEQALREVRQRLRLVPRGGLGYGLLRDHGGPRLAQRLRRLPPPEIGFRYLGHLDRALDGTPLARAAQDGAPDAPRRHPLEVTGAVADGALEVEWRYPASCPRATAEALADRLIWTVRSILQGSRAVQPPAYTPGDFPLANVSQRQLDRIAARFRQTRSP